MEARAACLQMCQPRGVQDDATGRQAALGYGLMRDGHGPQALETLVRYRGTVPRRAVPRARRPQGAPGDARAPVALPAIGREALSSPAPAASCTGR
jgi:hypothetical protein